MSAVTGPPCPRSGCRCTHTAPCDRGWITREQQRPKVLTVPLAERVPHGPQFTVSPDETVTYEVVVHCRECYPPPPSVAEQAETARSYYDRGDE